MADTLVGRGGGWVSARLCCSGAEALGFQSVLLCRECRSSTALARPGVAASIGAALKAAELLSPPPKKKPGDARQQPGPSSALLSGDKHPSLALSPECVGQAPAAAPGLKGCPYSHAASPAAGSAAPGSPLPTSLDFCKTLPKQFKSMCRRATPPGACPVLPARCSAPPSPLCPSCGAGPGPVGETRGCRGSWGAGVASSPRPKRGGGDGAVEKQPGEQRCCGTSGHEQSPGSLL